MENIILLKEELECDKDVAFNYFTQNRLLEKWLTTKAEVEPKIGGKFELFWIPENREHDSTIGCKITGIEKNIYLSFQWKGPQQYEAFMNFADPLTHVVVFFTQDINTPKNSTIHLFHTGWRNSPEWQEARIWFEKAWINAFNTLKEKIKDKTIPKID
ncbi:MAG: SRPBCC domain-containing protein [Promethearchaeota archaeon]